MPTEPHIDPEPDKLRASINELMDTFRQALIALIPSADRAKVYWRDGESYDDWDLLAETVFDVFVRNPITADADHAPGELPLARFDFDVDSYALLSWIEIVGRTSSAAFVRFHSEREPFDVVQVAPIDPESMMSTGSSTFHWTEVEFALVRRLPNGPTRITAGIVAVE